MAGKVIEYEELKDLLEKKQITLIDVRNNYELITEGAYPYKNVINIPIGELPEAFKLNDCEFKEKYGSAKPNIDDTIVLSCKSGRRAAMAQEAAIKLGYTNTRLYAGSFDDWTANGGPSTKK